MLTDGELVAWKEAATQVAVRANAGGGNYGPGVRGGFKTTFTMMARKLKTELSTTWSQDQAVAIAEAVLCRHGQDLDFRRFRADLLRYVRLGHALATGSAAHLSCAEAAYLAGTGSTLPDAPRPERVPQPPGPSFDVGFAFPYEGRFRGGRGRRVMAGRGRATVTRMDPGDFDDALDLVTREGRSVRALRQGARWFRTVTAPEGVLPLREDLLAHACSGSEPWADDPFAANLRHLHGKQRPALAVLEHTRREHDEAFDVEAMDAAAASRVVGLASVDGVIHVPCPAPTHHAVLVHGRETPGGTWSGSVTRVTVGWRLGDLDSESHLGPVPRELLRAPSWSLQVTGDMKVTLTFPHGTAPVAEAFVRAFASSTRFEIIEPVGPTPPASRDVADLFRTVLASDEGRQAVSARILADYDQGDVGALRGRAAKLAAVRTNRLFDTVVSHPKAVARALGEVAAAVVEGRFAPAPEPDDEDVVSLTF